MLHAAEGGEPKLQLGHLGAHDVLAVVEHAGDGGVDLISDQALLGLEID